VGNTRIRIMVLALVSVVTLSATAVATASAAEIEQLPPSGKFTVSSEKSTFETHSKEAVKCKKDSGSGEITGAKTDKSKVTFEGCTGPLGVTCTSSGAKSGDIETEVNSELSWLNKAENKVGVKLALAKEIAIKCSFVELKVKGSTLCPIEPVNTSTATFKIICKQTAGKQEFTELENESGTKIKSITETNKGSGFEESALESTETLTFTAAAEIKAIPVWEKTKRYVKGAKVEWKANSGNCYEAEAITEGEEPPADPPWEKVAC
jgi:hypothetical protein